MTVGSIYSVKQKKDVRWRMAANAAHFFAAYPEALA
jgi:hypothetical protein